jgi:hypothetical protein
MNTHRFCRTCGIRKHGSELNDGRCRKCRHRDPVIDHYRAYLLEVLEPVIAKCCEKDRSAILRALLMATERAA